MMKWIAYQLFKFIVSSARFSNEDRSKFTALLLDRVRALPIKDILSISIEGKLLLAGSPLTVSQIQSLREGAQKVLDSQVRKMIRDQVAFLAVKEGVFKGTDSSQILFSKAALWYQEEEEKLFKILAGDTGPSPDY